MIILAALLALLSFHAQAQCVVCLGIVGGGGDALVKVASVTASSSSSIQVTGLGSSYNTYFVDCAGLLLSSDQALRLYVGEGAGPTWETGSTYTRQGLFTSQASGTVGGDNVTTGNGALVNSGGGSLTKPRSLRFFIDNVSSVSLAKNITSVTAVYVDNLASTGYVREASYWNADTNAITGVELVPDVGNIASGTCTLYGLVK